MPTVSVGWRSWGQMASWAETPDFIQKGGPPTAQPASSRGHIAPSPFLHVKSKLLRGGGAGGGETPMAFGIPVCSSSSHSPLPFPPEISSLCVTQPLLLSLWELTRSWSEVIWPRAMENNQPQRGIHLLLEVARPGSHPDLVFPMMGFWGPKLRQSLVRCLGEGKMRCVWIILLVSGSQRLRRYRERKMNNRGQDEGKRGPGKWMRSPWRKGLLAHGESGPPFLLGEQLSQTNMALVPI